MATVTITDDGATIKLTLDGITSSIPKPYIVSIDTTHVTIKEDESRYFFAFADVTSPVAANIEALRVLLEGYMETGGSPVTIGAGSAVIGKVGIDQTTPGTTNAVAPTYYSQTIIAASTAASSNQTSGASNILGAPYKYVALQLNATSLSHADGVIKLQDSIDGSNWSDITGATITVASGSSVNMIRDTAFTGKYVQAVWTKGSNASGTLEALLMFKN